MSYQFIHIEAYAKKASSLSKSKKNAEFNKETKSNNVSSIIAEATREPGFCSHVPEPADPVLLFGVPVEELEGLTDHYINNTHTQDKNGKAKRLRSDANVLLAGVISLNNDLKPIWNDYKKDSIEYLKEKYGDRLKSVIEHTDESNPHFHFYVIQDPGEKFDYVHDGKKAMLENKNQIKSVQNIAYKTAMRDFQADFFKKVSIRYGLTKDGPKRARISRADYKKQQAEILAINEARAEVEELKSTIQDEIAIATAKGEKRGYLKAFKSFEEMPFVKKIPFRNKVFKDFKNEYYEEKINNLKKENKKTMSGKRFWKEKTKEKDREIIELKENFDFEISGNKITIERLNFDLNEKSKRNEKLILQNREFRKKENIYNNLDFEIQNATNPLRSEILNKNIELEKTKKENEQLKKENTLYVDFLEKTKKYLGDKFDTFLKKIYEEKEETELKAKNKFKL